MPEVQMPRLSDTMQEGVVSRWLKKEGDLISKGDILAEIETDKATMDLEAYDEGPLTALLVADGTTVPIGQTIAIIGEATSVPDRASAPTSPDHARTELSTPAKPEPPTPTGEGKVRRATPLVRKLAREHGLNLDAVPGTGPGGRIVRADIAPLIAARVDSASDRASTVEPPTTGPAASPMAPERVAQIGDDEEVPLTAIRRVTARRLTQSVAVPHFYLTSIIDSDRLIAFRANINEAMADRGEKVSVTDLLVRACAVALRAHPAINASWDGDRILRHQGIHIGVAVATDAGLIVPVIKDADRKSVRQISIETGSLTEQARAGSLKPQEFTGGTFTISNLGMYGVDNFTAIINPPEAAILAIGATTDTPVVRDGRVVVGSTTKLTLTVDHRVVDGAPAAAFLRELTHILQEPLLIVA